MFFGLYADRGIILYLHYITLVFSCQWHKKPIVIRLKCKKYDYTLYKYADL